MIAAYRDPDRATGRTTMTKLIDTLGHGVPAALTELVTLGRTLKRRAADVLAYFDRPGTSNGPTEAINGRLEHLRGSALGFRNLTNYIAIPARAGGFQPRLHHGLLKRWLSSRSRPDTLAVPNRSTGSTRPPLRCCAWRGRTPVDTDALATFPARELSAVPRVLQHKRLEPNDPTHQLERLDYCTRSTAPSKTSTSTPAP